MFFNCSFCGHWLYLDQHPFAQFYALLTCINCVIVMNHYCLTMICIQIISWLVAALVIVINGYLLLEFFSSEVNGAVFATIVCVLTAAYVSFILYLISRAITYTPWQSLTRSKTVATTDN